MKNILEITETNFETEVLQAALPVVVDFYAPWCGPCKMIAPLLDQPAVEFEERIKFTKLNVDDAGEVAGRYDVTGVPTLACFRGGQLVDSMVGFNGSKALKSWLETIASAKTTAASVSH